MIFISDLDHTLLNNQAELSSFSRAKLNELLERGLNFTVASARSLSSIQKILQGVNISLPIISFNGAYISDLKSGQHEVINSIDKELVKDVIQIVRKYRLEPFVATFNSREDKLYYEKVINEGMQLNVNEIESLNKRRLEKVNCLSDKLYETVVCINAVGDLESTKKLRKELSSNYPNSLEMNLVENKYYPSWYWLTIYDNHSRKDKAIIKLLELNNFKLDDLFVFGDDLNDRYMMKLTKNSIAVSNAKSEIKKISNEVIGSNEEDSVVKYIMSKFTP